MIKIHPDILKLIDHWIDYKWRFNKIPGISVGIVSNNKTVFAKGYGYKNLEDKSKTTPLTCYRIASVSKVFTALSIIKLLSEGKLKLTDPIVKFLPEFNLSRNRKLQKITIQQLLTHKGLMARDGSFGQWETGKFPSKEGLLNQLNQTVTFDAPETKWKYSNFGYSILGLVIEAVSGQTYEKFVQANIVKPLNLNSTSSVLRPDVIAKLATGYVAEFPDHPRKELKHVETKAMEGATGFSSNVPDLIQFMKAIIKQSPKILNKKYWAQASKVQWKNKDTTRNLFMWGNKKFKHEVWGHGGSFPGFITRMSMDLKNNLGVVILINMNSAPGMSYINGILSTIYSADDLLKKLSKLRKKPRNPKRFEGKFANLWGVVEVVSVQNQLIIFDSATNNPLEDSAILEHVSGNTFKIHDADGYGSNGEYAEFIFSKSGKLTALNWAGHIHKKVK